MCFSIGSDSIFEKSPRNVSISYHHGYLFPHHRLVTYFTKEYINGFDLTLSRYIPELSMVNPPEMGGGYYLSNLGNREIYGYTHGFYFYTARDFFKNKTPFYLQQSIGYGVSYNTKHFSLSDNYSNRNIGSHLNIFIMYSLNIKAKIAERLLFSLGPTIVHTSNGNIKQPNFGLNLLTTRLCMTYSLDRKGKWIPIPSQKLTDFNRNRYLFILSGGVRQLSHRIPEYFAIGSFITDYTRRLSPNFALGLGVDYIYDPTEGMALYVTGAHSENIIPWHIGAHLSIERIWNNISFVFNPGYKIFTPSEHFNHQYNRVGIRYRINSNFVLNYTLKSHKFVADFIEFGAGYIID